MKTAVLIMAHSHPMHLKRLINALDSEYFDIYVHIDAKKDISSFDFDSYSIKFSKLRIVPRRHKSNWGGIKMVDAMLELYSTALREGEYGHFIMISGEDYPICSNLEIQKTVTGAKSEQIVCCLLVQGISNSKIRNYWFWDLQSQLLRRCIIKALNILHIYRTKPLSVGGQSWEIYFASQWSCLSKACVEHVIWEMEHKPEIRKFFRFTYAPDEMLIPTIIFNSSEFKGVKLHNTKGNDEFEKVACIHYLRHLPQTREEFLSNTVDILGEEDFDNVIKSGKLFMRKVRGKKSEILLDMIDDFRKE